MSIWVCVPSARPIEDVEKWCAAWKERGYMVALWRDPAAEVPENADAFIRETYPGYAMATNSLVKMVLGLDSTCMWTVGGGDDVWPDHHTADEIALQCEDHFAKYVPWVNGEARPDLTSPTFGCMQPTGDRWGENPNHPDPRLRSAYIDRICGSPFMGREFCLRMNKGRGPFHLDFVHMHGDECLFEVAKKLGVLWQRPELTHRHDHWARARGDRADCPEFLKEVSGPKHWSESKALLERLRADDFAECMPL